MPVLRGVRPLTSSLANKMEENSSASEHVLRMSGCYNHLNQVGVKLPDKIVIDGVLLSLSLSYKIFVRNYDMQGMELIPELFAVLKTAKGRNQEGASSVDGLTRPLVSRRARARRETSWMANQLPLQ